MIDFRYHLVSIIAVFLALALGIVIGTYTLPQPVMNRLRSATSDLKSDNQKWQQQARTAQQHAQASDTFIAKFAPEMVAQRLTGRRVVIVEAPGASADLRDKAVQLLRKAGATVTGRIAIQAKYLDPAQTATIDSLADQLKPAKLTLPRGSARAKAAAELAAASVTASDAQAGQEQGSSDEILGGFKDAGYVTVDGNPAARATLALLLTPQAPFTGSHAGDSNTAMIALATAFDAGGHGAVLAGPQSSANSSGLVAALRGDSDAAHKVSTVDDLDLAAGRVNAVYALDGQARGKTASYGLGSGATPMPTSIPSPRSSPTTSPTGDGGKHTGGKGGHRN